MKKVKNKIKDKLTTMAIEAQIKAGSFIQDVSGSDTTEKIGMVVVAIVIVGLLAAAVKSFMPGLFESIFNKATGALEGIF